MQRLTDGWLRSRNRHSFLESRRDSCCRKSLVSGRHSLSNVHTYTTYIEVYWGRFVLQKSADIYRIAILLWWRAHGSVSCSRTWPIASVPGYLLSFCSSTRGRQFSFVSCRPYVRSRTRAYSCITALGRGTYSKLHTQEDGRGRRPTLQRQSRNVHGYVCPCLLWGATGSHVPTWPRLEPCRRLPRQGGGRGGGEGLS